MMIVLASSSASHLVASVCSLYILRSAPSMCKHAGFALCQEPLGYILSFLRSSASWISHRLSPVLLAPTLAAAMTRRRFQPGASANFRRSFIPSRSIGEATNAKVHLVNVIKVVHALVASATNTSSWTSPRVGSPRQCGFLSVGVFLVAASSFTILRTALGWSSSEVLYQL